MNAGILRPLADPVRRHGLVLLADSDDPHAELLALVWGPQFDRQQAQALLAHHAGGPPGVWRAVMDAADWFDHLSGDQQHRVRRFILRHRSGVTIPHAPPTPH